MSELKATPGPWLREGACVYALNGMGTNRMYVGQHQGGVYDDHGKTSAEELSANLDLIAAAPDMYEALFYFAEQFRAFREDTVGSQFDGYNMFADGRHWKKWESALSALAKARGEA